MWNENLHRSQQRSSHRASSTTMSVTTSATRKPMTRWQRIREALVVLNSAGPELCEMLVAKFGQGKIAAERLGISGVYFSYIRRGHRSPSVKLLELMAFEVEAKA